MKLCKPFVIFLLFCSLSARSQVILPYSINKPGLPADTTRLGFSVIEDGIKPSVFADCGIDEGDIVPDFILYDTAGIACQLSQLLSDGKPVILIAASFTCPQSRKNIGDKLKSLNDRFDDKINIRIIYTIDAHPVAPDLCPYTGSIFTTRANFHDSILFRQPVTYADRKAMAGRLIQEFDITVPVLIGSPSNEWWLTFGPAPNNTYLISPRGVVYKKYAWLEYIDFNNDIFSLLNDKRAMKTDVQNEVAIEKDSKTGKTNLLVKDGSHCELTFRNASGKIVFNGHNEPPVFDLSTVKLSPGEYSITIKTSGNESYCLRYLRE
ncbi:MAG: hypothetical protein ABIQ40_15960 [Bacteroidia bacterium]